MNTFKIMLVFAVALLSVAPMQAQEEGLIGYDTLSVPMVDWLPELEEYRFYYFPLDSLDYYLEAIVGRPVPEISREMMEHSEGGGCTSI